MRWRNSPTGFGLTTRLLHWAMAVLVLGQIALGLQIAAMQLALANLWLFGLHKTIGFVLLSLVLLRLLWHRFSPPPPSLGNAASLPNRAARVAHVLIYLCLILIPMSGWIASAATGIDVVIFGRITLPVIAPVSERWENTGFFIHNSTTKLLMVLLGAHVCGALWRAIKRDGTLRRMMKG